MVNKIINRERLQIADNQERASRQVKEQKMRERTNPMNDKTQQRSSILYSEQNKRAAKTINHETWILCC